MSTKIEQKTTLPATKWELLAIIPAVQSEPADGEEPAPSGGLDAAAGESAATVSGVSAASRTQGDQFKVIYIVMVSQVFQTPQNPSYSKAPGIPGIPGTGGIPGAPGALESQNGPGILGDLGPWNPKFFQVSGILGVPENL